MDIYDDEKDVSFRSWIKLKKSLHQEGYREGSSAGRDETFQNGFDSGFDTGFDAGYNLGIHNGILKYLTSQRNITKVELREKIATVELFPNPKGGLCCICTEDNEKPGHNQSKETSLNNIEDLKEKQKKQLLNSISSLLTEEYIRSAKN